MSVLLAGRVLPRHFMAGRLTAGSVLGRARWCYALVALIALSASVSAPLAQAETLTNEDVVKLVKAGLASDTINLSIRSATDTRFDTSANGLAALAEAGVPDAVVQSMIQRSAGVVPAPVPAVRPIKPNRLKVQPPAIDPVVGGQYYTRFNLWYEGTKHSTTNYTRGTLLPINSRVTFESISNNRVKLGLESGEVITIVLAAKFSMRSLEEIARELFSDRMVPIQRLGKDLSRAISQGTLRLGMTREQVLMTRGYPPRHKTPALDNDQWIYWSSRFVHLTLIFQDGLLARGRGLD